MTHNARSPQPIARIAAALHHLPESAAANTTVFPPTPARASVDIHEIVVRTATAFLTSNAPWRRHVHVVLDLTPCPGPMVRPAAVAAFVLSGWLSLLGREATSADPVTLRISTHAKGERAIVTVATNQVPPIAVVRGTVLEDGDGPQDPIAAHCRRLLLSAGGRVTMRTSPDGIAWTMSLPVLPYTDAACCPIPERFPASAILPRLAA